MPCIPMRLDRTLFVHSNILHRASNEIMGIFVAIVVKANCYSLLKSGMLVWL